MKDIDFGDWVLKEKEIICAVGFFFILMVLGFFISTKIEDYCNANNLIYQQATEVSDTDEFSHLMQTDGGNAFVEGVLQGTSSFSHPKIKGRYLYLKAEYQTEHEDTYTYEDEDGNTHTETTYYWETDYIEEDCTPTVNFCGVTFDIGKFDLGRCHGTYYASTGWGKRIVFNVIPHKMSGAIFSDLRNGTIGNRTGFYCGYNNESLREYLISYAAYYGFWCFWVILTIVLLLIFCIAENKWLDSKHDI